MTNDTSSNETQKPASPAPTPQQQTRATPSRTPTSRAVSNSSRSKLRDRSRTEARPSAGLFVIHGGETMFTWFVPPVVVPAMLVIAIITAAYLH